MSPGHFISEEKCSKNYHEEKKVHKTFPSDSKSNFVEPFHAHPQRIIFASVEDLSAHSSHSAFYLMHHKIENIYLETEDKLATQNSFSATLPTLCAFKLKENDKFKKIERNIFAIVFKPS